MRAYAVATAVFDLPALWERMRDPAIPTAVSDEIILESRRLLDRASRWLLTNRPQPLAVGSAVARFSAPVRALTPRLPELLQGRERQTVLEQRGRAARGRRRRRVGHAGGRDDVRLLAAGRRRAHRAVRARSRASASPYEVAALYYGLSEHLGVDLALTSVSALERGDRWHALARLALRDDLYGSLRAITLDALREAVARHAGARRDRAVGAGQRVAAGAGAGGAARGGHRWAA